MQPSGPKRLLESIEHTLLRPDASYEDVVRLCQEAMQWELGGVCVNPTRVKLAARLVSEHHNTIRVVSVCGFPLGASATATKIAEAEEALRAGASEIDMVQNIGWVKDRDWRKVEDEIAAIAQAVHAMGGKLKVILECCLLEDWEKETSARVAAAAGADFVKTSTGFSHGGATVRDVELLVKAAKPTGVKAAGGIRDLETAMAMLAAGAERIGTSSGARIAEELSNRGSL